MSTSIFARPDSPPPRQPSPDFVPAPLPSPHVRPSQSRNSLRTPHSGPSTPPGLNNPTRHGRLLSVRSFDHLALQSRDEVEEPKIRRRRSAIKASPPTTTRSLPPSSYSSPSSTPNSFRSSGRSFSSVTPSRMSPPLNSFTSSPPPPVPPIPAFILAHTDNKPIHQPKPISAARIRFPEFEKLPGLPETAPLIPKKQRSTDSQRSLGMTCMRFFSLRNVGHKPSRPSAL